MPAANRPPQSGSHSHRVLCNLASAVGVAEPTLAELDGRLALGLLAPCDVPSRAALLALMRPEEGAPTETERLMAGVAHHIALGPPLVDTRDGSVSVVTLDALKAEQLAAAGRGELAAADQLKRVRGVLAPRDKPWCPGMLTQGGHGGLPGSPCPRDSIAFLRTSH